MHEMERTQKQYYLCNMRLAYVPIDRRLHIYRERERLCPSETVKTQKQYYIRNMRSAYFPIDRGLHKERESKRERTRERGYVHL